MKAKIIKHRMGIAIDWQQDFKDALGAVSFNDHYLIFPKEIGDGCSFYLEVLPGLMLLIVDFTFREQYILTKYASSEDYCIAYYDLSEELSIHHVNGEQHQVGYQAQLGMGIVDGSLESTYIAPIGQRMYSFRLLISKELLKHYLAGKLPLSKAEKAFDTRKNTIFFYTHMDSRTKIALLNLRDCSFADATFVFKAQGTALQAFGYLIEKMSEEEPELGRLSATEVHMIMASQKYLLDRLLEPFPGIDYLADMAGMSASKYKKIFKKILKNSPNNFFIQEKLLLAKKLLESGKYESINAVSYVVGYSKPGHFSANYKKQFDKLPNSDFVKCFSET